MNQLRTVTRTSNWTPDRLRVLSAIVVAADHVSDDPLGRVEGVVMDDAGAIQSLIVKLWENGRAERAVLVPLSSVLWYTEGFAPALGISWTPEVLRAQPALPSRDRTPRVSLSMPTPSAPSPGEDAVEPQQARRVRYALLGGLVGLVVAAALGTLLQDPLLAVSIALLIAPIAVLGRVSSRPAATKPVANAVEPQREPWVMNLEQNLESARHHERRVLHFSLLRQPAAAAQRASRSSMPAVVPASKAISVATVFRTRDSATERIQSGTWAAVPSVRQNARASQGG